MTSIQYRISSDNLLQEFALIQPLTEIRPCQSWLLSKRNRHFLRVSQAIVKFTHLLFVKPYTSKCRNCSKLTNEYALHIALLCERTENARNKLWREIYQTYGREIFQLLTACPPRLQLVHILSGLRHFLFTDTDIVRLQIIGSFCFDILSLRT